MAPRIVDRGGVVVDLSADFRLKDPAVYEQWYKVPHTQTELLKRAAFGLPELFPDDLVAAARQRKGTKGRSSVALAAIPRQPRLLQRLPCVSALSMTKLQSS